MLPFMTRSYLSDSVLNKIGQKVSEGRIHVANKERAALVMQTSESTVETDI